MRPGHAIVLLRTAAYRLASPADALWRALRDRARAGRGRDRLSHRLGRPTAAVAYDRSLFSAMVEDAGPRTIWMCPAFSPGAARLAGQDCLPLGI